jgi:hypothetical protein
MVTVRVSFEDLLKAIENLPEEQKQIIRGRLLVTPAPASDLAETVETRLRQYRIKLYARARHYWESVGDRARLALTDAELDEQFWLFDGEGIPRLKSEQNMVVIPPNSSIKLAELAEAAHIVTEHPLDAELADDILNAEYADYLLKRMNGNDDGAE